MSISRLSARSNETLERCCRKHEPSKLLQAKKHGFGLSRFFVIGDRMIDVEIAHRVKAIGILAPEPGDQYNVDNEIRASKEKPDFKANAFLEVVDWTLPKTSQKSSEC